MQKDKLLKLLNSKNLKKSKVLSIYLLKKFLETQPIQRMKKDDDISFRDYLTFFQKDLKDVTDLFKPPYLKNEDKDATVLLNSFIYSEKRKPLMIISENILKYKLDKLNFISEPASTLTFLPNGNILSGTCYANQYGTVYGKIVLRDSLGKRLKNLVNEPASTLALLPDGNILSGTCYANQYGTVYGEIVLRDSLGKRLKSLVNEPASTLALLPNGNILSGTCYANQYGTVYGEIVLRDSLGKRLKNLVNEPASTLALLPDGNILSGTCYANQYGTVYGEIVLRDSLGKRLKNLINKPASTLKLLPDGNILSGTCYANQYGTVYGEIALKSIKLIEVKTKLTLGATPLLQKIDEFLLEQSTITCAQFHKGYVNPTGETSQLCRLPKEILSSIYSYVFPFPGKEKEVVINPDCFPYQTSKDSKQVLLGDEFSRKIFTFFSKSRPIVRDEQCYLTPLQKPM
ncbi:hypothetical protein ACQUW5_15135 [Legionella sp. CNM-1927-20]|uniref:hypothetical protein n=1 Tax=Legionella sp. CNM-1927-20 TaxID=3422221 RepID=UPI00403A8AF5